MHPILLEFGPFTLRSYGVAMALSFLLGIALLVVLNRREGRSDELALDFATWVMLGTVLGARALYVAVNWPQYRGDLLSAFKVWEGGLVFYGGLIGASLAGWAYLRRMKAPVWSVADAAAPGLALGQVTGRVGCWLNGCCYGREDHACGVVFPSIGDGVPHLPVMLYEAAFCLLLAGHLWWSWPKRRFAGQGFWSYMLLYALWRFGIEFLRGDPERGVLLSALLSPSQWISLAGAAAAGVALVRLSRRARP